MEADEQGRFRPGSQVAARPDGILVDGQCPDEALRARESSGLPLYLSVPPVGGESFDAILDAGMAGRPTGFLLSGARGRRDVEHLGAKLAVREALHDLPDGSLRILARVDDASSLAAVGRLATDSSPRLAGIAVDGAGLQAALGCSPDSATLAHAVAAAVTAARAAALVPLWLDVVSRGDELLVRLASARRDGFSGAIVADVAAVAAARAILSRPSGP